MAMRNRQRLWRVLSLTAALFFIGTGARAQGDYYVRPGATGNGLLAGNAFGSIEQARDAIRARADASIKGDITVHLMPGTYFLKEPLTFDNRDSGRNGHKVIYQARNPEQPTVLSSGRRVSGWGWLPESGRLRRPESPTSCVTGTQRRRRAGFPTFPLWRPDMS